MNYWADFFQIWYVDSGHKICKLIEISPVVIKIQDVKKGTVTLHMYVSTIITGVLKCYNMELDDNLLCLQH